MINMTVDNTILDFIVLLGAAVVFAGVCVVGGWIFVQAVKLVYRIWP